MAIIKAISSRASIGKAINYITKNEKTEEKLISGIECSPNTAIDEMKATKEIWNKKGGRQYKHFIHSFPPGEKITTEQAHKIAKELCQERFKGHEVIIATHKDTKHIHSHIIVNSVNYENGYKLNWSKHDLIMMKEHCNNLSRENGLSIPIKSNNIISYNQKKYKALENGAAGKKPSDILDLAKAYENALNKSKNKDEFIKRMNKQGYEVNWKETRKNITFVIPGDKKKKRIRLSNLYKTLNQEQFTKGELINELQRNTEKTIRSKERNNDWERIENDVGIRQDEIPKLSSDGVVGKIQQKIRAVEERTERSTGSFKQKNKRLADKQRTNTERISKDIHKSKSKNKSKNRGLER